LELPPAASDWKLVGVRTSITEVEATAVGKLVNNTGLSQTGVQISGILYDQQNQVISEGVEMSSYVPVDIVPIGGHVPFKLVVKSTRPIDHLELYAMSEPSGASPREDFMFSGLTQWSSSAGEYCLGGQLHNAGPPLEDYLIIVAFGYDNGGQLVSFEKYSPSSPETVIDDQASPFEMCIDPLNHQIARHELRALGS
jgi:hypothetical protein